MRPPTTLPKTVKNLQAKAKPQQRRLSSKVIKGKQPLLQTAMTHANLKFVMGQQMLTADELRKAGQLCIDLHNYYIQNYKSGQDIIVSYKNRYFLVRDDIFCITFSDLYDLFNLEALDISLMHCFAL
jgi:hypothetical protein